MTEEPADWVTRTADDVSAEAGRRHAGEAATCASGISPSGPIHLGNLRELMIPHLVADELASRGLPVRHILSWDDYDRLRKVPAGLPASFAEHIGRPLTAVPDPCGDHENWAEHYRAPFRAALAELGVDVTEISQTQMYRSGAYTAQIVTAMRRRADIGAVLASFRTSQRTVPDGDDPSDGPAGSSYYPYRPYCEACGRDDTTVTAFDDETTELSYTCACGAAAGPRPVAEVAGKLAWKVDWPMRWAFERVTFEPAGADHASPGSSFAVGGQLVRQVFGADMPLHFGYSFVGAGGSAKLSGSAGSAPTPADALRIFEPPLLRWLYARRQPAQAITLAFGQEAGRIYDEWDALSRAVSQGRSGHKDAVVYRRSAATAAGRLPVTPRVLPFRTLASVADITAGDPAQMLRILRDMTAPDPISGLDEVRPRLDRAHAWITEHVAAGDRTHVRAEPDAGLLAGLPQPQRHALRLLLDGLDESWSLDGLTTLLYGIPKIQLGLPADTPATAELKAAQRAWFALLYQLLVGADTGPRLPTLVLSLGAGRVRSLLRSP